MWLDRAVPASQQAAGRFGLLAAVMTSLLPELPILARVRIPHEPDATRPDCPVCLYRCR